MGKIACLTHTTGIMLILWMAMRLLWKSPIISNLLVSPYLIVSDRGDHLQLWVLLLNVYVHFFANKTVWRINSFSDLKFFNIVVADLKFAVAVFSL